MNDAPNRETEPPIVVRISSLTSVHARTFLSNYLTYEHAKVFRQLLVKRLALIAVVIAIGWAYRVIPTIGLSIGIGLVLGVAILATAFERRVGHEVSQGLAILQREEALKARAGADLRARPPTAVSSDQQRPSPACREQG